MANRLCGKIVNVVQGQIHAHVQILWKEIPLSVIITRASCEDMHLSVGDTIYVLIKGTDIMLAKSFSGMLSARNRARELCDRLFRGMCYQRFLWSLRGDMLHAFITNTSLNEMNIRKGDEVTAIVKSTELILSKEA